MPTSVNLDKWEKDKPNRCFLKKKVAIQGHKFNVVFFFDKRSSSGKLSMVALVSINKNAKNNKIFDSVFGLYVGKYGKPDSSKTIGTSTKVNLWFRPSGQIEYGLFANGPFVMCSIDYVAVKSESDKRESKVKNAFSKIIKTEVMTLEFIKAIESLTQNLTTAQNLNVPSIIPEIKQYINFCSRSLPILENLDGIEADLNSGNVIEARKNISSVKPNLPLGKEKFEEVANIIASRWEKLHKSIENEIESQIGLLKGKMPKLVNLVENKKTNEARSSLLTALNRAEYLGVGMTVAEINDLLKICDLQSTPDSTESKKKKKVKKTEPQIKRVAPIIEKPENIEGTMIVKHTKPEPMKLETPSVPTRIRSRSNVRRSPKKAVLVCPFCKATQPSDHERYCFFCGKQL